jgi:TatD DNase family protein
MELFDTHAHLLNPKLQPLDKFLKNCVENNVTRIMQIALGPQTEELKNSIELVKNHDGIALAAGLHPHSAKDENNEFYDFLIENSKYLSVFGEIGLDYFYDFSPKEKQKQVLQKQIEIANSLNLPSMFHVRDAHDDLFSIIENSPPKEGSIIHCFTGDKKIAEKYLDLGFYISFSGIVTFPKAKEIQEAAEFAPLDKILVETDSPYLAPVPYRGKRCEPAFVYHTANFIASLKGISLEEFSLITTKNSLKALSLPTDFSRLN